MLRSIPKVLVQCSLILAAGLFQIAAAQPTVPRQINHQGVVTVNGQRFTGTGEFRFAIVDGAGVNVWTNDGTALTAGGVPQNPVLLTVVNGIYTVLLGDTKLSNMMPVLESISTDPSLKLRVWFDDGVHGSQQLFPNHPLVSMPYAFHAVTADFAASAAPGAGAIPGEIRIWAGLEATVPNGWLLCDGAEKLQADYPALFAAIGTSWGSGSGAMTFRLPDLQGRFLRGVNRGAPGAQGDPDATSRIASNLGGNTGDAVGSLQLDATARPNATFTTNSTGSHSHTLGAYPLNGCATQHLAGGIGCNPFPDPVSTSTAPNHSHSITGGGDNETRPVNVYVHFIIYVGQ